MGSILSDNYLWENRYGEVNLGRQRKENYRKINFIFAGLSVKLSDFMII